MKYIKLILLVVSSVFIVGCGGSSNGDNSSDSSIKVACVGDSITEGYNLANPWQDSYPSQLLGILGEGWDVQNFGSTGASVMKSAEYPYWGTNQYLPSHDYNPDIVVIMLGTNDAKSYNWSNSATFVSDYIELVQTYQNLSSQPRVYICYPPPVFNDISGMSNARIINEVIPKIAQVASATGVETIDLYTPFSDKVYLFPDTIHPNIDGSRLMAEIVYQVIY